eukprot:364215-Chlamydomonas_euryale.AAC.7
MWASQWQSTSPPWQHEQAIIACTRMHVGCHELLHAAYPTSQQTGRVQTCASVHTCRDAPISMPDMAPDSPAASDDERAGFAAGAAIACCNGGSGVAVSTAGTVRLLLALPRRCHGQCHRRRGCSWPLLTDAQAARSSRGRRRRCRDADSLFHAADSLCHPTPRATLPASTLGSALRQSPTTQAPRPLSMLLVPPPQQRLPRPLQQPRAQPPLTSRWKLDTAATACWQRASRQRGGTVWPPSALGGPARFALRHDAGRRTATCTTKCDGGLPAGEHVARRKDCCLQAAAVIARQQRAYGALAAEKAAGRR